MSICIEAIVLEYSCLGFAFEFTAPEHSRLFDLMAVDACSRQVLAVTWLHSRLRQVTRVTMQFLDFMHLMVQVALLGFGAILPFLCPRGHGDSPKGTRRGALSATPSEAARAFRAGD